MVRITKKGRVAVGRHPYKRREKNFFNFFPK